MDCHCEAGFLTCSRALAINFPGYYRGLYVHNEKCALPQCNVAKFVREKRDYCEGNKSPSVYTDYKVNDISIGHLQCIYRSVSIIAPCRIKTACTWRQSNIQSWHTHFDRKNKKQNQTKTKQRTKQSKSKYPIHVSLGTKFLKKNKAFLV